MFRWPHPGVRAYYFFQAVGGIQSELTMPFFPVIITALARRSGYQGLDHQDPCTIEPSDPAWLQCRVRVMNRWVNPDSIYFWVSTISSLINFFILTPLGPIADRRKNRYPMLLAAVLVAMLSGGLILFVPGNGASRALWVTFSLIIVQYSSWGLIMTLTASLLRELGRADVAAQHGQVIMVSEPSSPKSDHEGLDPERTSHSSAYDAAPVYRAARPEGAVDSSETTPLLGGRPRTPPPRPALLASDHASAPLKGELQPSDEVGRAIARLSSRSDAITSFLAFLVLLIGSSLFKRITSDNIPRLKLAIGIPSLVAIPFILLACRGLRAVARHKPATVAGINDPTLDDEDQVNVVDGFKKMVKLVRWRNVRELSVLYGYLLMLTVMWDTYSIMASTMTIFFISTLRGTPADLFFTGAVCLVAGTLSAALLPTFQRWTRCSNKSILVIAMLLGTVPAAFGASWVVSAGRWGYHTKTQYLVMQVFVQVALGTFQTWSRALTAELIPEGHESSFFTLANFFRRGSSFIGPIIISTINNKTGSFDWAWVFLTAVLTLMWIPALFLNVPKGMEQARTWKGP